MITSTVTEEILTTQLQFEKAINKAKYYLPFYVVVPLAFWLVFHLSGVDMDWRAFGLGALGWVIALFLRGPLSAIVMKMPKEKAQAIIVGSSGVLEECVRLAVLTLTSMTFSWSISLGQGWAAVEVLFVMINVIVIVSLAKRTDEKAMQAKEILKMQGNLDASPMWGIFERIFASLLHIGFTLIAAKYPLAVILLIPLHSSVNLMAVKWVKKSVVTVELISAVAGAIAFLIGLSLFQ
jgi:hypothetical protein